MEGIDVGIILSTYDISTHSLPPINDNKRKTKRKVAVNVGKYLNVKNYSPGPTFRPVNRCARRNSAKQRMMPSIATN